MLRERWIKAGTTGGTSTRIYFFLTDATDYVTPETGEAGGQPQISTDGAAWTDTGIGTLSSIGNGSYYADLTTGAVATAGKIVLTRYKSSNTSEARGTTAIVTAYAPSAETQTVSLGTSTIGTAQLVDGAFTAAKFAANAITSTVVADGTITAAKIGADAITAAKIADNAVAVEHIASGALTEPKFAALSLTAAKFSSDLNAYTVIARVVQTGASAQQLVVFIYKNGESLGSAGIDPAPTVDLLTTGGTEKLSGVSLTEYGNFGWYTDLSGGSLLNAGEAAEATVTFTLAGTATTVVRSGPVEKQYA